MSTRRRAACRPCVVGGRRVCGGSRERKGKSERERETKGSAGERTRGEKRRVTYVIYTRTTAVRRDEARPRRRQRRRWRRRQTAFRIDNSSGIVDSVADKRPPQTTKTSDEVLRTSEPRAHPLSPLLFFPCQSSASFRCNTRYVT
ncbi:hypothetical protein PUN28_016638 [Cardiocondyla obscurior]|uniref:Uncharacterized protein n=1 Tax=Cardiocondyla obscurior TaxID=286306 RepID=A0AAW2EQ38_9HYME